MRDNWLDEMPHKSIIWHSIYDLDRQMNKPEVDIAIDIEARLAKLITCARLAKDEPESQIKRYEEAVAWLQERLI